MIIEDDTNIRKLLRVNLMARGFKVLEAEEGRQGLDILRNASPSILLLDIKLPDISGWDLLKIMASDHSYPHIPVIVITASLNSIKPEHDFYDELRKVLVKPLNIQELTDEIKKALV